MCILYPCVYIYLLVYIYIYIFFLMLKLEVQVAKNASFLKDIVLKKD